MSKLVNYTIILLISIYIAVLYIVGNLNNYINERYIFLTLLASIVGLFFSVIGIYKKYRRDNLIKSDKLNIISLFIINSTLFIFFLFFGGFGNIFNLRNINIEESITRVFASFESRLQLDFSSNLIDNIFPILNLNIHIILVILILLGVLALSYGFAMIAKELFKNKKSIDEKVFVSFFILVISFLTTYYFIAFICFIFIIIKAKNIKFEDWTKQFLFILIFIAYIFPSLALQSTTVDARSDDFNAFQNQKEFDNIKYVFDTLNYSIGDWVTAINKNPNISDFVGKDVNLVGFVYKDESVKEDKYFTVAKFVVRCCAVDGIPTGLAVEFDGWDEKFREDEWVRVQGTFEMREINGISKLVIAAQNVEKDNRPADPYIYI